MSYKHLSLEKRHFIEVVLKMNILIKQIAVLDLILVYIKLLGQHLVAFNRCQRRLRFNPPVNG